MTEDLRTQFSTYSAAGNGIIDFGYHADCAVIVEMVDGDAIITIGTDTVEASIGDFIYVPSGLVFRIESSEGMAAIRALVFDMEIIKEKAYAGFSEFLYER